MERDLGAKCARLAAAAGATLALAPAQAIDPGWAKGSLRVDDRTIALTHAYVHRHDNEEGLLEGRELRILLADREVPESMLAGVRTAALEKLARRNGVQGVLLTVDPAKPDARARGVLLAAESNPAGALARFSATGVVRKLREGGNRVRGEASLESPRSQPAFACAATFDAPLFHEEPLSARLSGDAAAQSAPFKAFAAYRRALATGDLDAARRLVTAERDREVGSLVAQTGKESALKVLREISPAAGAGNPPQVFVRGTRALIVYRNGGDRVMQPMHRTGNAWLVE